MKRFTFLLIMYLIVIAHPVKGQDLAIKTNLLYGAGTLTPNLGMEIGLGKRTSFNLSVGYNPWNLDGSYQDNKKLVHLLVEPEWRYWLCQRFNGHFFGVHALYAKYNVGGWDIPTLFEPEYRYQGYAYGGGISYGYHHMLSKRWGVEFTLGLGVAQLEHTKYDCSKCGDNLGKSKETYLGPTKAGISLIYILK